MSDDKIKPGLSAARIEELAGEAADVLHRKACTSTMGAGEVFSELTASRLLVSMLTKATDEAHAAGAAEERARIVAVIEAEIEKYLYASDEWDAMDILLRKVRQP